MAPKTLVAGLAVALALAACGGKGDDSAGGMDVAKLRAKNDSVRKARAVAPAPTQQSSAAATPVVVADSGKPAKPSAAVKADTGGVAKADSAADSTAHGRETEVLRESFVYAGGARDPFGSLISLKTSGPELADLRLVGIYENLQSPSQSVAVLREKTTDKLHKLRVGEQLGRLRVTQIRSRDVVFTIQDFGYDRQETLSLRKQEEDSTP